MEASAVHAPAGLARLPLGLPLLKLRSDEQLLALFRAGSDEAFGAIHDRYRQRLFAYVRQMMCAGPRQDAEDVLQDVFVRAYGALRADEREVNLRAWLYRVAHNRCIDHLRRPVPPAADIFELSRKPLHDPIEEAQRREDLARLVADIGRLPEQQRSALLMREIDGMSYADLAGALDVSVPAIKSLLVRARIGLVEAAEARDADCADIRRRAARRVRPRGEGVQPRPAPHAQLRRLHRLPHRPARDAALVRRAQPGRRRPAGDGRREAAGLRRRGRRRGRGRLGRRGGGAAVVGGAAACKVAAVVCTAALTAGGAAVEVRHLARTQPAPQTRAVEGRGTRAACGARRSWRRRRRRPSRPSARRRLSASRSAPSTTRRRRPRPSRRRRRPRHRPRR